LLQQRRQQQRKPLVIYVSARASHRLTPRIMLWDLLLIITASLLSTLLAEGISWVLIYRTASYQLLKASIDKTSKKRT